MNASVKKIISTVNDAQVRFFSYKTTRQILPYIQKGDHVLDIGSGLGFQAQQIQKKVGCDIKGVDVVDYQKTDISYQHFDGVHIPHPDKFFDVSYFAFVLHHAKQPIELLQDAIRVTKKKIIILEDTPQNFFDWAIDGYHGWSFNTFFGLSHKTKFRTKEEWEEIFVALGISQYASKRLSRFDREPFFPISRTRFVLHLET